MESFRALTRSRTESQKSRLSDQRNRRKREERQSSAVLPESEAFGDLSTIQAADPPNYPYFSTPRFTLPPRRGFRRPTDPPPPPPVQEPLWKPRGGPADGPLQDQQKFQPRLLFQKGGGTGGAPVNSGMYAPHRRLGREVLLLVVNCQLHLPQQDPALTFWQRQWCRRCNNKVGTQRGLLHARAHQAPCLSLKEILWSGQSSLITSSNPRRIVDLPRSRIWPDYRRRYGGKHGTRFGR